MHLLPFIPFPRCHSRLNGSSSADDYPYNIPQNAIGQSSCCGSISASSPKGRAGLGLREWTCAECGTLHDRDVNAARNILAAGHSRLVGGIPFL
ncbi:zinc ribbon domain-containing protein [Thiothrix litoralis]|uniref:zinc ribbon domain-containing protein n=1 Tax=Thiothrix litoralis TaxID=2891210 RepID=UPI003C774F60